MNDVRFPIETVKEGNKITKTCVEDVYKIVNRVYAAMNKAYNNSVEVLESLQREDFDNDTSVIIGRGVSQPCLSDAFDEEIGNNIAFMKMKLNANIKKYNFLSRVMNSFYNCINSIDEEIMKVEDNIRMDIQGIRKHNPDFLRNGKFEYLCNEESDEV